MQVGNCNISILWVTPSWKISQNYVIRTNIFVYAYMRARNTSMNVCIVRLALLWQASELFQYMLSLLQQRRITTIALLFSFSLLLQLTIMQETFEIFVAPLNYSTLNTCFHLPLQISTFSFAVATFANKHGVVAFGILVSTKFHHKHEL